VPTIETVRELAGREEGRKGVDRIKISPTIIYPRPINGLRCLNMIAVCPIHALLYIKLDAFLLIRFCPLFLFYGFSHGSCSPKINSSLVSGAIQVFLNTRAILCDVNIVIQVFLHTCAILCDVNIVYMHR